MVSILKKFLSVFISVLILLSATSCKNAKNNKSDNTDTVSNKTSTAETKVPSKSESESNSETSEITDASSNVVSNNVPSNNSASSNSAPINVKPSAPAMQKEIYIPDFSEEINQKIASLSNKRIGFSWAYPESDEILNHYNTYTHGDFNSNILYLTFDEGYEYNNHTAQILDILKEKQVKAVFFVTLSYVKSNPHYIRRMIDEGHAVGNHTVNHPDMTAISLQRAYNEIKELHDYMLTNFNYSMSLFRFPTGAYTYQILELINQMGYKTVFWNFAHKDWETNNQPNVAESRDKVLRYAKNGTLYLLHACSSTNVAILPDLIDGARQKGYTFEVFK